jgi:ribose 5-phosphate isomerase B
MKIALGSDHRGDHAAGVLAEHLTKSGHDVEIVGTRGPRSRDYPDAAWTVGRAVAGSAADLGVLLCGSGNGVAIAANKIAGIRAAVAGDAHAAAMARQHNNANVLAVGSDHLDDADICTVVDAWLNATFEGGRHARRVEKIAAIERGVDPTTIESGAAAR